MSTSPLPPSTPAGPPQWPDERAFLHALSTPLATLGLELDHLREMVKNPNDAQESVQQMRKILDRIFHLIQARRAQLPQKQS